MQLPTFSFVTVTTTVSVPDGGTVLLGGIKRLSEGRNEFGVPMLNKMPYINRLFKNVGIGRETQSLMMMVTPRIIIQEEEEEKLGVTASVKTVDANSPLCANALPVPSPASPPSRRRLFFSECPMGIKNSGMALLGRIALDILFWWEKGAYSRAITNEDRRNHYSC